MVDIKDYFLIGDLHTAALISKYGSIDWLCLPHFDSPSLFARLLDENGGAFSIHTNGYTINTNYVANTAIVEFMLKKGESEFQVRDFMVPYPTDTCDTHFLIRKIKGLSGNSRVVFTFEAKPDYAQKQIHFEQRGDILSAVMDDQKLILHLPKGTRIRANDNKYDFEIEIQRGEIKPIVLEETQQPFSCYSGEEFEEQTRKFWIDWISKGSFFDFCQEQMIRSAITLKLLQFFPTGALIAAPTTSLPEEIGGIRNWDYRYVWIRDATFTLYAFYILGYEEEMMKFFSFIESAAKGCIDCNGDIHLLYTIQGNHPPTEYTLSQFSGFKSSTPVRVGNAAFNQFQLDLYGSLIDAYYFMWRRGATISDQGQEIIISLVNKIMEKWRDKDNGIWEVRDVTQHYTYSKVMAWVGVDRAVRMSNLLKFSDKQREAWKQLALEIKNYLWKHCFNKELKSFTQYPTSRHQDATNLLFVLLQFLNRHDERTKRIIEQTCKELCTKEVFVSRYLAEDGLQGGEGAFALCSFWLIAALAAVGKYEEALHKYVALGKYVNPHGLLSEEINTESGEYLGNYPQAFSHLGLILAAYYIHKYQ